MITMNEYEIKEVIKMLSEAIDNENWDGVNDVKEYLEEYLPSDEDSNSL